MVESKKMDGYKSPFALPRHERFAGAVAANGLQHWGCFDIAMSDRYRNTGNKRQYRLEMVMQLHDLHREHMQR